MSPELSTLLVLARAARDGGLVRLRYRSGSDRVTERTLAVLGVGYRREEGWVCAGWCTLRGSFRELRLDRIVAAEPLAAERPALPGRFDARAFATEDLELPRSVAARRVTVRLAGGLAEVALQLFPGALLEREPGGAVRCHARTRRLDVLAGLVVSLGEDADAPQPGELRAMVGSIRAFERRLREGAVAPVLRHPPSTPGSTEESHGGGR